MFYGDGIPITDTPYEYPEFNPAIVIGEFSVGSEVVILLLVIVVHI